MRLQLANRKVTSCQNWREIENAALQYRHNRVCCAGNLLPCCARPESGHAAADPAIPVMKSRRRIAFPMPRTAQGSRQCRVATERIKSENCDWRNRGIGSVCAAAIQSHACLSCGSKPAFTASQHCCPFRLNQRALEAGRRLVVSRDCCAFWKQSVSGYLSILFLRNTSGEVPRVASR